jgi:phosphatidylethanolamine/phosphatidyl-N-methylethanolamine N-methyltransferase
MRETVSFLKQSLVRFRQMGSLVPSSPQLARAMVAEVPDLPASEVIVELGPGTGVFTRELIARFPGNRVVAVEFNPRFAERLAMRMPEIDVVQGCASFLPEHLESLGIPTERVGAVVSGLPLLSLPRELGSAIFAGITRTLAPGRRYIQFTYSKRAWRDATPAGFRLDKTKMVWLNFPPAEVLPFTRIRARTGVLVA